MTKQEDKFLDKTAQTYLKGNQEIPLWCKNERKGERHFTSSEHLDL